MYICQQIKLNNNDNKKEGVYMHVTALWLISEIEDIQRAYLSFLSIENTHEREGQKNLTPQRQRKIKAN